MNICTKYGFDILIISGSYGGHRRHTTYDGRRTTDDGRRTTPRVWHKLPTGELTTNLYTITTLTCSLKSQKQKINVIEAHFVDIKVSKQLNKTCQISVSPHEQYNCFIFMIEIDVILGDLLQSVFSVVSAPDNIVQSKLVSLTK